MSADVSHSLEKLTSTTYQSLLTGLTDIINPARNQNLTATLQAQSIRAYGQALLRVIVKNPNLETQEKVDVIGTT
jgi:hypothetical protein